MNNSFTNALWKLFQKVLTTDNVSEAKADLTDEKDYF